MAILVTFSCIVASSVASAAHKLKGAAANIHAQLLRSHAEEREACAFTMDGLELDIHLTQMRLYSERTSRYLETARKDGKALGSSMRCA